ncbi:MAG: hypothetical protein IKW30_07025 [Lachnospiraceae bacterium]|nr:hypothetical protein [Lachnospiraceae bacterium]
MNKNLINHEIQAAYDALRESKIVDENDGSIKKTYRGQISSFGAAITMGSLISSVAFFSADGGSEVERSKLMKAILLVLKKERGVSENKLFDYVVNHKTEQDKCKEEILNAAIALKLAMNLYKLKQ